MPEDHLEAFVRESEGAVTELNDALLELEADPEETRAMDEVFRTAHTLKGNFRAMGFEDAADLAHALEDVLDAIRRGELAVTPAVVDLAFAGVDRLDAIVDSIGEAGDAEAEVDAIVDELRTRLAEGTGAHTCGDDVGQTEPDPTDRGSIADSAGESDGGRLAPDVDATALDLDPADAARQVIQAVVDVGETDTSGVDAMVALDAIEDQFPLLATVPDRWAIEGGGDGTFAVFLDAAGPDTVESTLRGIGQVRDVAATAVTEELADAYSLRADDPDEAVQTITSARVELTRLETLQGLVEQLVTNRATLRRALERGDVEAAAEDLDQLDAITGSLRDTVIDMRVMPLGDVIGTFPRMVRDLARDLGKDVEFTIEGEDIELDRTILTEMSAPLMHAVRNAIDHGIEPPAERAAAGKPRTGTVELRARRQGDHVLIEVADDGAGLDADAIRTTAIDQGIRSAAELEGMDDSAIYELVFHPGLSTAAEVSETSGRGVGMDVVRETVSRLDGSVSVDSTPGEGTTVRIRLPVSMAVLEVLFVAVGDQEYGVPLKTVDAISRSGDVYTVNGREVITHEDDVYPVVDLGAAFDVDGASADGDGTLLKIRPSDRQVALRCDAITGQAEVVVKPLEGILAGTEGLSGTALLGNGSIVHIVDVVTV